MGVKATLPICCNNYPFGRIEDKEINWVICREGKREAGGLSTPNLQCYFLLHVFRPKLNWLGPRPL